ncbi:hypothetical protein NA57DRAFT_31209 [Rhizodiscina lignyota]|uniref:Septin-type G domain-containing protein n=1 Tax=Rhizodiscina lignyota TaxID=1504668 RepID=A0A9P4IP08_9PEZI|nr:hypothetical protein NA57DRAFT_31209 [Rhizodiscina lignyota]
MSKKQRAVAQEELARQQREAAALARSPPRLPSHSPLPTINAFGAQGAQDMRPDSVAIATNRAGGYSQPGGYPQQQTQGGGEYHAMSSHVPIPPIPHGSSPGSRNGDYDPYPRTESMTHRGRYSYASSAVSMGTINSPRRVRRRRDPTPFNILVIGAKNSGKTSFINFLRTSLTSGPSKKSRQDKQSPSPPRTGTVLQPDSAFTSQYLETEVDTERIGVTLWDSQGLEKNIVDLQLREMSSFLESKFEETFTEEQKVIRAPGVRDTHIHIVFLILDPVRLDANINTSRQQGPNKYSTSGTLRLVGGLDEDLDLQILRSLQGKTTVIPVISKADTITTAHMTHLKRTVWASLKQAKMDPLEVLNLSEEDSEEEGEGEEFDERDEDRYNNSGDEEEGTRGQHRRSASAVSNNLGDSELPYLPMSIISPDMYDLEMSSDDSPPGRRFPWGFADPYNAEHCDFVRLKDSVFSEWRAELREASRERWYEGWRTSRLKRHNGAPGSARTGTAGRPMTVGTAGAVGGGGMRSPNGRPSGIYGAPGPGTAVSTGQGAPPNGKTQSMSAADMAKGGVYRGAGQYQ